MSGCILSLPPDRPHPVEYWCETVFEDLQPDFLGIGTKAAWRQALQKAGMTAKNLPYDRYLSATYRFVRGALKNKLLGGYCDYRADALSLPHPVLTESAFRVRVLAVLCEWDKGRIKSNLLKGENS